MICDECETVAHCLKNGCVPKQIAPVQPVAWAEYHYKKGMFTGLTTNDINAVDSVGDGCQWVPQLQATPPNVATPLAAQLAPVPLTDELIGKAWAVADGEHNASASVKRRITRAIEAAHGIAAPEKGQS